MRDTEGGYRIPLCFLGISAICGRMRMTANVDDGECGVWRATTDDDEHYVYAIAL
jgi:hypothetical protein